MFPRHDFFVRQLHDRPVRLVLAVTGGGSDALSQLLTVPGASKIIVEAVVPYSSAALVDWLGGTPEKFCDERTARLMAMKAFERARVLEAQRPPSTDATQTISQCVGVACTASLASEPPKKGPHRLHIAWQSATATSVASLELLKRRRTRGEEEILTADLILNEVAAASGVPERVPLTLFPDEGEVVHSHRVDAPPEWTQ